MVVTPDRLRHFTAQVRKLLRGDDVVFRRDLIRALAERIEIHTRSNLPFAGDSPLRIKEASDFKAAVLQILGARERELVP